MEKLCLIYLLSVVISVSSNPLGQLVQSCNVCQPTSYSNPASIPVVIPPSNTNPYSQAATAQIPTAFSGPLGDTLNQVILNKILGNPSLQKIIDPNTKLYNQNGEAVQRQVPNAGVPNVINNYFIVPPEFFNLNETISKNDEEVLVETVKRPRRRKLKRRLKKVQHSSNEEDDIPRKVSSKRRKQNDSESLKSKRSRNDVNANARNDSIEITELDESQTRNIEEKKHRQRKKKKEQITSPLEESDEDEYYKLENLSPVVDRKQNNKKTKKSKPRDIIVDDKSIEVETEVPRSKSSKGKISSRVTEESLEDDIDIPQAKQSKKGQRKTSDKKPEDKILKNIEIPTDISNRDPAENRQTRDSKKNGTKKNLEQKQTSRREPSNITPFPDEVLNNFFPYMPMGNFHNSYPNYPYNFDQYYQYLDPNRNYDANRNKRRRKNQNRKNNQPTSKTHTIEIKLKPKKKDNATEAITTEKPEDEQDITVSIEADQSIESIEQVTAIPMEMPHKVSPSNTDETESGESYETFSKLEDLHEFITPELGKEEEVPHMTNNRIINDYYPVFDDDVYYSPYVEKVKNLEDDRYFYETGNEDKVNKEIRKFDRYEEPRVPKRDAKNRGSEITDTNSRKIEKSDPDINKYDHNEYLDHISTFSDNAEHEIVKSSDGIRRVKVPPKNTRVKTDIVETVSAGSKVVKYGIPSDESSEDTSSFNSDDGNYSGDGTTYVVAKSLGRPEDYW